MKGLPAVESMAVLAYAGLDHRPFLHAGDEIERLVDVAVAERVIQARNEDAERLVQAQGAAVGNRVGQVVGRALSDALKAISRAMARA